MYGDVRPGMEWPIYGLVNWQKLRRCSEKYRPSGADQWPNNEVASQFDLVFISYFSLGFSYMLEKVQINNEPAR